MSTGIAMSTSMSSTDKIFAGIFKVGKYVRKIRKYSTQPVSSSFTKAASHCTIL